MVDHQPVVTPLDLALLQEGSLVYGLVEVMEFMDSTLGASDWSCRQVAAGTIVVLGILRFSLREKQGVLWFALCHAVVAGFGSLACVWVSEFGAVPLTGITEPLRSLQCQGPLTSLHRILPAVSMGFGIFDIVEGFAHSWDFLLHGIATFSVMAYFCEYDVPEIIVPMLMMEISTVPLNFVRAKFLSDCALGCNMMCFVTTFFLFRIFVCPYYWWRIVWMAWEFPGECLPWHLAHVSFGFGMFFNVLNSFWGYKIIRKLRRKMSGREKLKDANDLAETEKTE